MAQMPKFLPAFCAATVILASGAAVADTDRLSAERMTAIKVAFDQVLADPEANVDALSDARLVKVSLAYDSLSDTPDADTLPPARWAMMQEAYTTHDPDFDRIAALAE